METIHWIVLRLSWPAHGIESKPSLYSVHNWFHLITGAWCVLGREESWLGQDRVGYNKKILWGCLGRTVRWEWRTGGESVWMKSFEIYSVVQEWSQSQRWEDMCHAGSMALGWSWQYQQPCVIRQLHQCSHYPKLEILPNLWASAKKNSSKH